MEGDYELWIGKDVEENSRGWFKATLPAFDWRN
jgi:hypothetical protein